MLNEAFTEAQYKGFLRVNAALSQILYGLAFVEHEHAAPSREDEVATGFDLHCLRHQIGYF